MKMHAGASQRSDDHVRPTAIAVGCAGRLAASLLPALSWTAGSTVKPKHISCQA